MSQRDFQAIADIIRKEGNRWRAGPDLWGDHLMVKDALYRIADQTAAHCKSVNPNFKTERFMAACGF